MLRVLRLIGIVIFVLLIGLSSSRIQRQYRSGELFERYNSQRKADITLLIFSFSSLIALISIEYISNKRRLLRRGYRSMPSDSDDPKSVDPSVTNIYAAPETQDQWKVRHTRGTRSRHEKSFELSSLWMSILRIYSVVLPVFYLYLLLEYVMNWLPHELGNPILTISILLLFIVSTAACIGVFRKRMWGVTCGYPNAVFLLLIFPIGTAIGLFMLIALAGATPEFVAEQRKRQKEARKHQRKRGKRSKASAVMA